MRIARAAFDLSLEGFRQSHARWQSRIPEGLAVRRYDRALTESAPGIVEFWGSIDAFLQHGLGFAVLQGEETVSRCHTVLAGDGRAEISIETQEAYRRQGLATLACCAFIESCLDGGLRPEWSCWHNNAASIALAEKLGFERAPDVPVVYVHQEVSRPGPQ
jgi:RimJ/RimL family protein N-acetyltransferase